MQSLSLALIEKIFYRRGTKRDIEKRPSLGALQVSGST